MINMGVQQGRLGIEVNARDTIVEKGIMMPTQHGGIGGGKGIAGRQRGNIRAAIRQIADLIC